jgi:hypothetical protein
MPLQTGKWTANFDGEVTQLQIDSVDNAGHVTGTIGGGYPFSGFWDEDSQHLTFLVFPRPAVPAVAKVQIFVGYLFTDPVNLTGSAGSVFFTLTGYIQDFTSGGFVGSSGATARRSLFGWYAQIGVE